MARITENTFSFLKSDVFKAYVCACCFVIGLVVVVVVAGGVVVV